DRGVAMLRSMAIHDKLKEKTEDIQIGINIVKRAVEEPIRQIANNAGYEGSVVVNAVKEFADADEAKGFDAQKERYVNMFEAGIIDPTKVVRCALQNAASIAALMLTTEAIINEIPEEERKPAMGGHGMGGGDMY